MIRMLLVALAVCVCIPYFDTVFEIVDSICVILHTVSHVFVDLLQSSVRRRYIVQHGRGVQTHRLTNTQHTRGGKVTHKMENTHQGIREGRNNKRTEILCAQPFSPSL